MRGPLVILAGLIIISSSIYAQSGTWTWINGSNQTNPPGVYGAQGIPNPANTPQGFYEAAYWIDLQGNFWIFGGLDDNHAGTSDLWKYDPVSNEWAWMKGPGTENDPGNFGTKGVPSPTNNPSARGYGSCCWTDNNGDLWLFGGNNESGGTGVLNDLWRYQISANEWTWMNGTRVINAPDNYGSLGTFSYTATPGGRDENLSQWVDIRNRLWLFGGEGYGYGLYNDMWCFDVATNEWAWISGPQGAGAMGSYGQLGVEAAGNLPASRGTYTRWQDNQGNFYVFGGKRFGFGTNTGYSDVWRYNTLNNYWTWIAGDTATDALGDSPAYCVYSGSTGPCARFENRTPASAGCMRSFLTFGGFSQTLINNEGSLNDLWLFDIGNKQWKLLSGTANNTTTGNYGIKGIGSSLNVPPGRGGACTWIDNYGNFWLFGGMQDNVASHYNDLWKFTPDQGCASAALGGQIITNLSGNTICAGDSTLLTINSTSNAKITPTGDVIWKDSSHVYLITDTTTTFTITGQTPCGLDTEVFTLTALPGVKAAFTINPPQVTIAQPVVNLNNQSTNYSGLSWFMDSSLLTFISGNTVQFSDTGIYCINLAANNADGCTDTARHCVAVIPLPLIAVPGAFSPNGDGVNDYFTVFGKNLSAYNIRIFNRWGEVVYFSNNLDELNNLGRGWDGTYKGKLQDPGTFVYSINATDDGGNKIEKKGDLILIR